ncbi:MAG: enoyl-CoA hydratase/isomerase family protein, partial [Kamptonema sp. SIO1D9]|nr:enoyl-CoA hydratase/isomerase family protein [Kamptonema sp. SIO1D9]
MYKISSSVLSQIIGKTGTLTLNRPKALHALNTEMCEALTKQLLTWIDDTRVELVVFQHAPGTRGFCAGGDVKMLADSGARYDDRGELFFQTEYRLNELISRYPKPIVAVMDGITMGGGVGLSIHATYQIATQNTVLAMPETGIGLFPDVGSTWFLPRLNGELGTWLALTGARLKGSDVLAAGMATHFCDARQLKQLQTDLSVDGCAALGELQTAAKFQAHGYIEDLQYLFAGE